VSAVATLGRPYEPAPAVAPRRSRVEEFGIIIGRVVVMLAVSGSGSRKHFITLSDGLPPSHASASLCASWDVDDV
jgi:hypothetical protein